MDTGLRKGAPLVAPAKAGAWGKGVLWIPAFAGMTRGGNDEGEPDGGGGMKGRDEEKPFVGPSCI